MQGPALMIEGKRKNMNSSRLKSKEQTWKNGKIMRQKGEEYFITLSSNLQKQNSGTKKDLKFLYLNIFILLMRQFKEVG